MKFAAADWIYISIKAINSRSLQGKKGEKWQKLWGQHFSSVLQPQMTGNKGLHWPGLKKNIDSQGERLLSLIDFN